jgi:hypothetical protein
MGDRLLWTEVIHLSFVKDLECGLDECRLSFLGRFVFYGHTVLESKK